MSDGNIAIRFAGLEPGRPSHSRRPAWCSIPLKVAIAVLAASTPLAAQVEFVDVSAERSIGSYTSMVGMAGGVAAADYDDDGDVDIFVPTGGDTPDLLYRNLGDGSFEEIGAAVGLASMDAHRAALWFDYDGDHDLDLVVTGCDNFEPCGDELPQIVLYEQVDGTFSDVTTGTGLALDQDGTSPHVSGMCAGDINNDGYLDLCVAIWRARPSLFLNNGDGTFTDIGVSSGAFPSTTTAWQPMMHDFDGDGWLDIFINIDFASNRLLINQGDNTFQDVAAAAGVATAWNEMGLHMGDYDNDGDLDLYMTNIYDYEGHDYTGLVEHNILYRNDSAGDDLAFVDVAVDLGVDQGSWGWGTTFLDCDNDGWLDLAATNGFTHVPWITDTSKFFLNAGGDPVGFIDVSADVGFDDTHWGSSLVTADFDRDGDLDLLQSCIADPLIRLLDNQNAAPGPANHYLLVRPRMDGNNHRAIGAVIRLSANGLDVMRLISAGASLMGQEPAEAFFGAATAEVAESLTVEWPDGTETTWMNVPLDRMVTLYPGGACSDINMDTVVGFGDLVELLAAWGPCSDPPDPCDADLDGNGSVDFFDLLTLLSHWNSDGACAF